MCSNSTTAHKTSSREETLFIFNRLLKSSPEATRGTYLKQENTDSILIITNLVFLLVLEETDQQTSCYEYPFVIVRIQTQHFLQHFFHNIPKEETL